MDDRGRELRALLAGARRRWLALRRLSASARAALLVAGVLLGVLGVEALVSPGEAGLVGLAGAALCGALAGVVWMLWSLRGVPSDRQVARFIEERCPQLEDRLASAAELAGNPDRVEGAWRQILLFDALVQARQIEPDRIVSRRAIRRAAIRAAGAIALLVMVASAGRDVARRALDAATLYAFPPQLSIEVMDGDMKVVAGRALSIVARVRGARGAVGPTVSLGTVPPWRTLEMRPTGDRFVVHLDAVTESFRYRVSVGSTHSTEYGVRVIRPPHVTRVDLRYEYPRSLGLAPRTEQDSGDIYAPAGTRVRVRVQADKPVHSGAIEMASGARVQLGRPAPDALGAEIDVVEDGSYRIALADLDGLTNPGDTEYFIRVLDDRPPDVRIVRPAGDRQVTSLEEILVEARADDDYGVERLDLVYAVRGGAERVASLSAGPLSLSRTGSRTVYLEDLDVQPGDFVTYYARARDVSRGKRPTEARSDIFFLEVKPFGEEFVAAQSQSMMGGGDRSLDDLAATQKEIIIATWKLDRRSLKGRASASEQDVRSIARAQAELKARAEQVAGQFRAALDPRRRRNRPPSPTGPGTAPSQEDPMARAVEAMGRAEDALDALKTADALPHEMEALSQLLKAQADVRRRHVARQQANAGGAGGSNRANQDLSSLFDRELQRQQQTNYETPASSDPQDSQSSESAALDKVRELARRQDELGRRQQDLAAQRAQMSVEEVKRQLERLTREQSELRREAEELSRRMGPQAQGGGQNQRAGGAAQAGSSLRDISEEMRSAASELRRQDPAGASHRSERALEKLRDLEQQLRHARPDDRRRALGDLQLDAQQLADAERRIETEAARGAVGGDAARRLAGEQDRLADRIDRMKDALTGLARSAAAGRDERRAIDEAVKEVERQRLRDRMREAAAGWRRAADPRQQANAARDLARALDRVAGKIGDAAAPGDAGARKLSEQLARARDVQDRLREMERELETLAREAASSEGRGAAPASGGKVDEGRTGQGGSTGDGRRAELRRLQDEYGRQRRQAQELMDQIRRDDPSVGQPGGTPEGQYMVRSAPGTEAFKQDFARWDRLRRDVHLALERVQESLSSRLQDKEARDRMNAGADDRPPDEYRALVGEYYRSLAKKRKP